MVFVAIQSNSNSLGQSKYGQLRRPRNGQDMNIGIWNITSFTGKEVEIVEEMEKYKLDILGISEVKKKGKGEVELTKGFVLRYSGCI